MILAIIILASLVYGVIVGDPLDMRIEASGL